MNFLYKQAKVFAAQTSLLELDDLMAEGVIALLDAIDRFDMERGERFLTYATHWVKHHMREAVVQAAIRVSAPVDILTRVWANRFARDRQTLRDRGVAEANLEVAVARANDMSPARLLAAESLRRPATSMDQPLGEDADRSMHDVLADVEPSAEQHLLDAQWATRLQTSIALFGSKLPWTRRVVFAERLVAGRSLKEVGQILDLSRERIRQIERVLLDDLRDVLLADFPSELEDKSEPNQKRVWRNLASLVR